LIFGVFYGFVLTLAAVYVPLLNKLLGTVPLKPAYWLLVFGVGIMAIVLTEIFKFAYFSKKDENEVIEKKVSAIIPAYNEETTVGQVVSTIKDHPLIDEIIVVDDGSYDRTNFKAEQAGAFVLRLNNNQGKGIAMSKGVSAAKNNIILFLDADIVGLNHEILSKMITAVTDNNYDMYVGITDRKLYLLNKLLLVTPILGEKEP